MEQTVPAYTIMQPTDTTMPDLTGRFVRAKRIPLRFADGTSTYLEVPLNEYNSDRVSQLANEAYATHQEVVSIEGPQVPKPQPIRVAPPVLGQR